MSLTNIGRRGAIGLAAGALATPAILRPARAASRTIKLGFVSPRTGPIAAFGEADEFVMGNLAKVLAEGVVIKGVHYPVQVIQRDSQSNPNRAAEVTGQLIRSDKVDIMLASSTSDTVNPVSDQCEVNGVPCITTDNPWQAWFFGRKGDPKTGFDWTYHFFWGVEAAAAVCLGLWDSVPTNKRVGCLWSNDPDGNAVGDPQMGLPAFWRKAGYDVTDLRLFPMMSSDFSAQISALKQANVDIVSGVFIPPDFATFWTQAAQQGFRPKVATVLKALLFPSAVEALGDRGAGLSSEVWWSPGHPFKSSLTGQSSAEFAAEYTAKTKREWTQPMGFKHALIEVAFDVLKRTTDVDSPEAIRDAIRTTNMQSLVGHVGWNGAPGPINPMPNVCTTPLVGGQWTPGKQFKYDLLVANNSPAPFIPLGKKFELLPS
jgi:branched-chain amino acid transport system substrate-binding protein